MVGVLSAVFFVSGASALIFEVLWFHQAGLAFGNSVWASSLILTGFMAGLASGNALATRHGDRIAHPMRAYILMELIIATTGIGLIYLLPISGSVFSPLLSPWIDQPWIVNPIRLLSVFFLLLIPSTAMGVTLPLLTKTLSGFDKNFGSVLGKLYGWNTLGAVLGVTVSEFYLIEHLGIHGTGLFAGGLNIIAAAVVGGLVATYADQPGRHPEIKPERIRRSSGDRWLAAAFVSGFCLLALEVIWFRFLSLFVTTTTMAYSVMLAIVLAGIAIGGLAGSFWIAHRPQAYRHSASMAFLAGALCVGCYAGFAWVVKPSGSSALVQGMITYRMGIPLMFPVSFVSGILFVLLGAALRHELNSEMQTAGALTLANTLGAAFGSFVAGFLMLPQLGLERSFFLISLLYGCLGLLLILRNDPPLGSSYKAGGIFIAIILLFPWGVMKQYLQIPARRLMQSETPDIVSIREGLTETITYLRSNWYGNTVDYRMITNSFSMSGTGIPARRYMKLFVYWPVAVHPNLKKVLLISYGVGNTAKALTDTRRIETIDIVDISRDILDMNSIVYPREADQPLHDPRVRIHVEDGRYFLQTTTQRFDLITGEPPPPTSAGVVNLYTREYFEWMRLRLAEGGIVTYWLPMHGLSEKSAKSIVKSFCDVFTDCSLWNGAGPNLMMVGTRNAQGPVLENDFTAQWRDPIVLDELKNLGFEKPEQLGALFIGDAAYLHDFLRDTPPLVDNFPKQILWPQSTEGYKDLSLAWTHTTEAKERFKRSALIQRLWPEHLRAASLPYFDIQESLNIYFNNYENSLDLYAPLLHQVLKKTLLETPALWLLGSDADQQRLLKSASPAERTSSTMQYLIGVRAFSKRKYADAIGPLTRAEELSDQRQEIFRYRIFALCMSGQLDRAQRLAQERLSGFLKEKFAERKIDANEKPGSAFELSPFWQWMKKTFGIDPILKTR